MTNKIIIDGWNLAWKIPEIARYIPDDLHRARTMLKTRIQNYYQQKNVILKIVYDGKAGILNQDKSNRKIDIRYSRDPEKADHLIIKFLKKNPNPKQWSVVTSDRELAGKVSNSGARVISSETFLKKISSSSSDHAGDSEKQDPQLSRAELDYWMQKFQENDNEK